MGKEDTGLEDVLIRSRIHDSSLLEANYSLIEEETEEVSGEELTGEDETPKEEEDSLLREDFSGIKEGKCVL